MTASQTATEIDREPSAEASADPLAPTHARSHKAIVALDVVGFCGRVERNEVQALRELDSLLEDVIRPLAGKWQGTVVDTAGDGSILAFDRARDAVSFAIELQSELAETFRSSPHSALVLRAGVHFGPTVMRDGRPRGECVNLAARLESAAEPGGILISESTALHLRISTGRLFTEIGRVTLKNVSRNISARHWHPLGRPFIRRDDIPGAIDPRPTVAVLRFACTASETKWRRLAAGMSDDILTDLARSSELAVMSRHSSFAFGSDSNAGAAGRALGAGYILLGMLQIDGNRLRLNVRLMESSSESCIWTERFDTPATELFAVQDAIVERVVSQLAGLYGVVLTAERRRAGRRAPSSLGAYHLFLAGLDRTEGFAREEIEEGIALVEQALALDPSLGRAWLTLAWAYGHILTCGWSADRADLVAKRAAAIREAQREIPYDPLVLVEVGDELADRGDHAGAVKMWRRALEIGPMQPDLLANLAKYVAGAFDEPEQACLLMDRAFRLAPNAPAWYHMNDARVRFLAGHYERTHQAISRGPRTPLMILFDALSRDATGDLAGASRCATELRSEHGTFDPHLTAAEPWLLHPAVNACFRQRLVRLGGFLTDTAGAGAVAIEA